MKMAVIREVKKIAEVVRTDLMSSAGQFRCTGVAKNTAEEVVGRYENERYTILWKLSLEGEDRKYKPSSKEAMFMAKDCTLRVHKALSAGKFRIRAVDNRLFVGYESLVRFTCPLTIKPMQLDLIERPIRKNDADKVLVQFAFNW
ncbi:MAG: hypothetical protein ACYCX4_00010 [Bacillota bacterium]